MLNTAVIPDLMPHHMLQIKSAQRVLRSSDLDPISGMIFSARKECFLLVWLWHEVRARLETRLAFPSGEARG